MLSMLCVDRFICYDFLNILDIRSPVRYSMSGPLEYEQPSDIFWVIRFRDMNWFLFADGRILC